MLSQNTLIYVNKGHNKSLRDQYIYILQRNSINLIEIFVYTRLSSFLFCASSRIRFLITYLAQIKAFLYDQYDRK